MQSSTKASPPARALPLSAALRRIAARVSRLLLDGISARATAVGGTRPGRKA